MTIKITLVKNTVKGNVRIEHTTGIRLCNLGKFAVSEGKSIEEALYPLPDGALVELTIPEFCPRCKQPIPSKEGN